MLADYFQLRGYQVFTAEDGQEGVQIARAENPDIVISDIRMPAMNGDQMLQHMKSFLSKQTKYIVVTAHQDERTREKLTSSGIDAYYEKPVSILELHRKVEEFLHF